MSHHLSYIGVLYVLVRFSSCECYKDLQYLYFMVCLGFVPTNVPFYLIMHLTFTTNLKIIVAFCAGTIGIPLCCMASAVDHGRIVCMYCRWYNMPIRALELYWSYGGQAG